MANNALFEAAIDSAQCRRTVTYDLLSAEERRIFLAHIKAVKEKRLWYSDPETGVLKRLCLREYSTFVGYQVATVAQLLYNGDCCGNACRHCPYNHVNVSKTVRKSKTWNGAFFV